MGCRDTRVQWIRQLVLACCLEVSWWGMCWSCILSEEVGGGVAVSAYQVWENRSAKRKTCSLYFRLAWALHVAGKAALLHPVLHMSLGGGRRKRANCCGFQHIPWVPGLCWPHRTGRGWESNTGACVLCSYCELSQLHLLKTLVALRSWRLTASSAVSNFAQVSSVQLSGLQLPEVPQRLLVPQPLLCLVQKALESVTQK